MKDIKKEIVNEGFAVAQQFLQGNLKKVSIDITVLQKILDDDFSRDLFVIAFNDEIEQFKKIATGENND